MPDTSARMLRLLSLLQTRRAWPGSELAERLGVSGRTVRNDIDRLRELGYPVDATRGAAGGYRLGAGAAMPPLLLDDEEAVAVTIALRTATQGAVPGTEETAVRALTKLEQVLPSRLRRRVRALQTFTVAVPADRPAPAVSADVLTTLVSACRDRERLRFDYLDHAGSPTRRLVEPYRAVNWGRRWYLVAWDVEREDWRTFRVDRMRPRTPTGPRFTPREPPGGDITAYVSLRVSSAAWRHHARVTVHAPATAVIERINPAVGTVQPLDADTCVLTTGADTVQTLAAHLGMLDFDFDVTEPVELVDHLRRLADRYARSTPRRPPSPDDGECV
ncbi:MULTISPECIES: helix-turn-helix transcriptional regulator [Streptomyces]|uniref:Putative DNA-binding transcriptional regulator YafY n=1 Tax=Streptomyces stelliscabiei TaxID=146820 RepID=A0A8I0PF77_9ACTN|nr:MULTISPECIES: YafY family protein [Streptomyces]KND42940.1 DeoR faimly transcriptional regulator [Streptomyces stelliscabiei]MBE1602454.1 putative DNA-binding transcriptional regulator YafY [Streptomyces stelliscabiei]MDX2516678.1 YafY family protein [Streptomyces stelliscabiei]SOD66343.1 Predicted DNA-binding transcriptional regulator YafY, contains an HTH and WYL domains [Streptomyces sp. 1222.2]